jgi:hypothetical protein
MENKVILQQATCSTIILQQCIREDTHPNYKFTWPNLTDCLPIVWIKATIRTPFIIRSLDKRFHVRNSCEPQPQFSMVKPSTVISEENGMHALMFKNKYMPQNKLVEAPFSCATCLRRTSCEQGLRYYWFTFKWRHTIVKIKSLEGILQDAMLNRIFES